MAINGTFYFKFQYYNATGTVFFKIVMMICIALAVIYMQYLLYKVILYIFHNYLYILYIYIYI